MLGDVERASRPNDCFHRQLHVLRRKDAFQRNLLRQTFQLFDAFLQRLEAIIHVARMKCRRWAEGFLEPLCFTHNLGRCDIGQSWVKERVLPKDSPAVTRSLALASAFLEKFLLSRPFSADAHSWMARAQRKAWTTEPR
jgi:hypothetical protein